MWELDYTESWAPKNWCFWSLVLEKTLESPLDCKEIHKSILKGSVLGVHWKDWCWSWNSSNWATSCEELTHWKRLWCWEGLGAGGEGDDRGWNGWMASLTQWTWVCVNSGCCWWTGRPGVLWFMGLQRVRHDWVTEPNWYNPVIPPLGIDTKETRIEKDTCTPVFIAALFTVARTRKQPRCPLADEWIRKPWYIYKME